MRQLLVLSAALLVVSAAGAAVTDPIVADWKAAQTCRHGGCSDVYGTVRVTQSGSGFVAVVTSKLWLLGDAACTHPAGQQVWTLTRVTAGSYKGTSDVFTSDSSPGFNCQHSPFAATWTLTGKNKLTLDSTAYGGISHVFSRTPLVDETAPTVTTRAVSGVHGKTVRIPFTVRDDSGRATVHVTVTQGKRSWSFGTPGPVSAKGEPQAKGWAIPRTLRGTAGFCVWAEDEAGNVGAKACGTLRIR